MITNATTKVIAVVKKVQSGVSEKRSTAFVRYMHVIMVLGHVPGTTGPFRHKALPWNSLRKTHLLTNQSCNSVGFHRWLRCNRTLPQNTNSKLLKTGAV
eukprot:1964111-Amphidinium_carterae.1